MRTSRIFATAIAPAVVVASLCTAVPAMAATSDAVTAPVSSASATESINPQTLSGQAALVAQAQQLLPADARAQAKLILTETRPSQKTPGATDVEIGFAQWTTPVTIFDTVATVSAGSVSFSPVRQEKVPYTPDLDPFIVNDFLVSPTAAAAAAKAYNPAISTAVMDMRRSTLPHQGISYAFGTKGAGVVIVSGTTGKVITQ